MNEINLRSIDLNLLTVFEAVYEEKSQTKACERLAMTQPAVSHALGRLRQHVGDRLFTGRSKGLQPTSYADELYVEIHQALSLIRAEFSRTKKFDPSVSKRTFVICVAYGGGSLITIPLFKRIRSIAPGVKLVFRTLDTSEEIAGLLREHRVDLAVQPIRSDDEMLEQRIVYRSQLAVMVRKNHPRINARSSIEQILAEEFVNVYEAQLRTEVEQLKAFARIYSERTILEVPSALMLPYAVKETDLLAITSSKVTGAILEDRDVLTFPLPLLTEEFPSFCAWHKSLNPDPAHTWLRQEFLSMMES
jgi:DNA-binding transcriptional LysR family regulator